MKKIYFIIFIICLILVGITIGIILYNDNENNSNINNIENEIVENKIIDNVINSDIDIVSTSYEEEKISPSCIFIFKTLYKRCEHIKVEKENATESMINKNKEELESIYKNWNIVTFRSDEVMFYREEEGICNEHFLLKEHDGVIGIYEIDEDENINFKENTSIVTTYLTQDDLEKLEFGIRVNGIDKLNQTLEDYE